MQLIKLKQVASTNDFLKAYCREQNAQHGIVVVAEDQTMGRGQQGAHWQVEPGKNLTFSMLMQVDFANQDYFFALNAAVSVAIVHVLNGLVGEEIKVKWPNDIIAGHKKVGGVLIENLIRGNAGWSVIGVGINVNQATFYDLPFATSLSLIAGRSFVLEDLLTDLIYEIEKEVAVLPEQAHMTFSAYHDILFKKGESIWFLHAGKRLEGIILGVSAEGNLRVNIAGKELVYGFKEISLDYASFE